MAGTKQQQSIKQASEVDAKMKADQEAADKAAAEAKAKANQEASEKAAAEAKADQEAAEKAANGEEISKASAAALFGIDPEEVFAYSVRANGDVVVVTIAGQKLVNED